VHSERGEAGREDRLELFLSRMGRTKRVRKGRGGGWKSRVSGQRRSKAIQDKKSCQTNHRRLGTKGFQTKTSGGAAGGELGSKRGFMGLSKRNLALKRETGEQGEDHPERSVLTED